MTDKEFLKLLDETCAGISKVSMKLAFAAVGNSRSQHRVTDEIFHKLMQVQLEVGWEVNKFAVDLQEKTRKRNDLRRRLAKGVRMEMKFWSDEAFADEMDSMICPDMGEIYAMPSYQRARNAELKGMRKKIERTIGMKYKVFARKAHKQFPTIYEEMGIAVGQLYGQQVRPRHRGYKPGFCYDL